MAIVKNNVPGSEYGNVYVDSLVWGGYAWDTTTPIKVWFGDWRDFDRASDVYGESEYLQSAEAALEWTEQEASAFAYAVGLYESVCGLSFELIDPDVEGVEAADIVWWKTDLGDGTLGVHDTPFGGQHWGYFNPNSDSWSNLHFGGAGLNTIIHELGHGMGLAHPHDGGDQPDGTSFPGVPNGNSSSTGTHGLNQGIWTVMSYNTGWGRAGYDLTYGNQGGLGAFDIIALQVLYGQNMATARGNDVYQVPTHSAAVGVQGWECIWDAGGRDTIAASNARAGVSINLRAATLKAGDPNAGGYVSREGGVKGCYTIAYTVVIENATGGRYEDMLHGNTAANTLKGSAGKDGLWGYAGNDILMGGSGNDTLSGSTGNDAFVFDKRPSRASNMDRIADFNGRYDTIQLDNAIFKKLGNAGRLKSAYFELGSKADYRNDYLVYNKSKGVLYYDADGSGRDRAVEIAVLSNKTKVSAGDFLVI